MKNILLVLIVIFVSSCIEEKNALQFLDEPQPIVGKWKAVSITIVNTGKIEAFDTLKTNIFEVRYDGIALAGNGRGLCCVGLNYLQNINGKIYQIKNKEPIPNNPDCNLISCTSTCSPVWTVKGDSLFLEGCYNLKYKYVRVK